MTNFDIFQFTQLEAVGTVYSASTPLILYKRSSVKKNFPILRSGNENL